MALGTQRQYNAYACKDIYKIPSFEKALVELLAVSDAQNTEIIEKNWGYVITRLSEMYLTYKLDKTYGGEGVA
jgi:hypothetical protein